jgi:O-antigen/teichoic acid export membrane protein
MARLLESSLMNHHPTGAGQIPVHEPEAERLGKLDLRSLWKNASWTSGSLLVTALLAFAETILLARFLGVTLLGVFFLIRAYPEAVQQVLDCRTRDTVVKYLGEYVALDQHDRAGALVRLIWLIDVVAGLIAMAIVFSTASIAARYVAHEPTATWPVAAYAVSQFVGTLDSASGSVMRVFGRFGVSSVMGVYRSVGRFALILVVVLLGGRILALVYAIVAIQVAYTAASTWISVSLLRKHVAFRAWSGMGAIGEQRRQILKFLLQTNIAGTLKMSSEKLLMIVIGALGGAPVAAQYKIASQVGSSIVLVSDPLYLVIYPTLSKMVARKQWEGLFGGLRRLQRIMVAFTVPAAAVASGLMVILIPVVFGEDFAPAIIPGIIIMWAGLPEVTLFWLAPLLFCLDQASLLVKYRALSSVVQLIVALALVPFIGATGAAVSLLAMHWLYFTLKIRLGEKCRQRLQPQESAA